MKQNEITKISVFQGAQIRKVFFENEWYFSVVDVIAFLTDSPHPGKYWQKMKSRDLELSNIELSPNWRQLKFTALDGKLRPTDCANTEGIFRIIQSIPSPKAEPFKQWLARIGKERIDEIENPELGMQRVRALYEKRATAKIGLKKDYAALQFENNLPMNGNNEALNSQRILQF